MTIAAFAPPRPAAREVSARTWIDANLLPGLFAAALFVLSRPYGGLDGDARLYFGRVLADADPAGVGSDFYFANNGQFGFSIFPNLVRPFVMHLGPSLAGLVVAAAACLCCFAALVALAHSLVPAGAHRAAWLIVVFATIWPVSFGTPSMFDFAEAAAIPRPFAEAAVLAALACLLRGRVGWSLVLTGTGLLIHPIMGLVGCAVVGLALLGRVIGPANGLPARVSLDVPSVGIFGAVAVVSLAAVVLLCARTQLLDRLTTRMDSVWLELVLRRSFHLFPTGWAADEYANLLVQTATIAIAARIATPASRHVLVAVLAASLTALAASCLFGDLLHSLLFIQAQLWRSIWLLELIAAAALAICVPVLAKRDETGRMTLALLLLSWISVPSVPFAIACAAGAATLQFDGGRLSAHVRRRHVVAAGGVAAAAALVWTGSAGLAALHSRHAGGAAGLIPFDFAWNYHAQAIPIALMASAWALAPGVHISRPARCAMVVVGLGALTLAFLSWDARDQSEVALDGRQASRSFETIAAGRPAEVFWVDGGSEAWMALDRPQWLSHLQAVGVVFSRPLALEWQRRADLAFAYGLARPSLLHLAVTDDALRMTDASLRSFCSLTGAPGTIVLPLRSGIPALPNVPGTLWHPDKEVSNRFKVIPCAPARPDADR